jgi:hypothetical protein
LKSQIFSTGINFRHFQSHQQGGYYQPACGTERLDGALNRPTRLSHPERENRPASTAGNLKNNETVQKASLGIK